MPDPRIFGKLFIAAGVLLLVIGAVLMLNPKILSWVGHLPGDIALKKKNFSFYFPITTCILLSAVLSLVLWHFSKK